MSGDSLQVLVLGAGSIGTRHANVLKELGSVRSFLVPVRAGRVQEILAGGLPALTMDEALATRPDAVVVATDTERHVDDARTWLDRGVWVLVEKPLSVDEPSTNSLPENARLRVACSLRSHLGLGWVRRQLNNIGRPFAGRITCQSYLPDWRPHRDYRASYSAEASQGGVLRDLIHELDYAQWLFGLPDQVSGLFQSGARLGIQSEAGADLVWRWRDGFVLSFRLDYLTRSPRRTLQVDGEQGSIELDFLTGRCQLREVGSQGLEEIISHPADGIYHRQMEGFLALVRGKADPVPLPALKEARATLAILDLCRASAGAGGVFLDVNGSGH